MPTLDRRLRDTFHCKSTKKRSYQSIINKVCYNNKLGPKISNFRLQFTPMKTSSNYLKWDHKVLQVPKIWILFKDQCVKILYTNMMHPDILTLPRAPPLPSHLKIIKHLPNRVAINYNKIKGHINTMKDSLNKIIHS